MDSALPIQANFQERSRMFEDAKNVIRNSSKETSVYVGCDSVRFKKNGKWFARYATVVVVHYDTCHGASIFHNIQILPDFGNIKLRILNEAMFAGAAAAEIEDCLEGRYLEIHLDINPSPQHKSNVALSEAVGYVLGTTGVKPLVKPASWAASHCADFAARGKPFH